MKNNLINLSSKVLDRESDENDIKTLLMVFSEVGDVCFWLNIGNKDEILERLTELSEAVIRHANACKININLEIKDEVKPVTNSDVELIEMIIECISSDSMRDVLIPINALAEKRGTNIIRLLDEEYND